MQSHHPNLPSVILPNPYRTSMYGNRLSIEYYQPAPSSKPTLSIQISLSLYNSQFYSLINQCGFFWHATCAETKKHVIPYIHPQSMEPYLSLSLIGHRKVEEALKVLQYTLAANFPAYTYLSNGAQIQTYIPTPSFDYFDTQAIFNELRMQLLDIIAAKNTSKQKKSLITSINYDALTIIQKNPIKTGVFRIETEYKDQQGQLHQNAYFKKRNEGPLGNIEAFINEMFLTLVGEEYGSRMDLLFDSLGSRVGMMSPEIKGFQTLNAISTAFSTVKKVEKFQSLSQKLIRAGVGKIEAFNYLFADGDANAGNIGFNDNDQLRKIDFGRALWPITCFIHTTEDEAYKPFGWLEACCPKDAFPIHEEDIINLPILKHAKPHNALYLLYQRGQLIHLMHEMANNPQFLNDKWYIFFKYLLLDEEIYQTRLDGYISSVYWKEKILTYLLERKLAVETVLLHLPQFQLYMIHSGTSALKNIIKDFEILNRSYTDRYASFNVNIDNIAVNGKDLLLKTKGMFHHSQTILSVSTKKSSKKTKIGQNKTTSLSPCSTATNSMTLFNSSPTANHLAKKNNDAEQLHIQQGDDYQAKLKLKEALSEYDKALALNRMNLKVYCKRGYIYYLQGKLDEAIDEFDKVINEDAHFSLAYIHRARAHYLKQNRSAALCDYISYINSLAQSTHRSEIIDELQNVVLKHQDTMEDDIALFSDENKIYIRHCLTSIQGKRLKHFSASPFKSAFSTESKINSNVISHSTNRL